MSVYDTWYLLRTGRCHGPYNARQIHDGWLYGRVFITDQLSTDGQHWEPVTQLAQAVPREFTDQIDVLSMLTIQACD